MNDNVDVTSSSDINLDDLPTEVLLIIMEKLETHDLLRIRSTSHRFRHIADKIVSVKANAAYDLREASNLEENKRYLNGSNSRHLELTNTCKEFQIDLRSFRGLTTLIIVNLPLFYESDLSNKGILVFDKFLGKIPSDHVGFDLPPTISKITLKRFMRRESIIMPEKPDICLGERLYRERFEYCVAERASMVTDSQSNRYSLRVRYRQPCMQTAVWDRISLVESQWRQVTPEDNFEEFVVSLSFTWPLKEESERNRNSPIPLSALSFRTYIALVGNYLARARFTPTRLKRFRLLLNKKHVRSNSLENVDSVFETVRTETLILAIRRVGIDLSILFSDHPCAKSIECFCLIAKFGAVQRNLQRPLMKMLDRIHGRLNQNIKHFSLKFYRNSSSVWIMKAMSAAVLNCLLPACPNLTTLHIEITNANHADIFDLVDCNIPLQERRARLETLCIETWCFVNSVHSLPQHFATFLKKLMPKRVIIIRHNPSWFGFNIPESVEADLSDVRFDILNTYERCYTRDVDILSIPRLLRKIEQADSAFCFKIRDRYLDKPGMIVKIPTSEKDSKNISFYKTHRLNEFYFPNDGAE
ncbi:unnamed protein product [Bemisia tabaci]|uniref:F-box domain-containing protein n=1 Tax=Bemisia tabaci TaxID=7038 RepID=A0A9P0AFA9_BEMTA|nr:unnamed protein product [Bemisia tabaci]